MKILGIETSCDDTCAAVLIDDRVISNVISSQTDLHKDWGGVVPDIAKRAHQARIMPVIMTALKRARMTLEEIEVIAVTKGPGLAIALSVGVNTAKDLAKKYKIKLVAVNHVEGHVLSNLVKNKEGKPDNKIVFPALCLTASGGHTKIILINQSDKFSIFNPPAGRASFQFSNKIQKTNSNNKATPLLTTNSQMEYTVVGETLDDAAGEALDKAAKLLGLGYPGGPVIERVAKGHKTDFIPLPKPLADKKILDYSFSGLKTSFYYKIKDWPKEEINKHLGDLAATFQESVFDTLLRKFDLAIDKYQPKTLMASGGVLANMELRKKLRKLALKKQLPIMMPVKKWLNTDNASMIGRAGWEMAKRGEWADPETLDRDPRMEFEII